MANNYGANQYKQTAIKTANPGQILIMLYEAAIKHCKTAAQAIDRKDIAGKGMAIGKVHDIINELTATLNFEVGGDIARNLERLYNFMGEQLVKANVESSKEALMTVQKLLETLLEGWRGAVAQTMGAQQKSPTDKT
jgi:flagellar protein FliS